MAKKKSAASKGFRKSAPNGKKPFLTKKEIIALIVIVLVAALIWLAFELFYNDGYISGLRVHNGDITASASKQQKSRYLKLGELGDPEGYTLTIDKYNKNANRNYTFTNDDPDASVTNVAIRGSFVNASDLVDQIIGSIGTDNTTPKTETVLNGHTAYVYSHFYTETPVVDAEADEEVNEEELAHCQNFSAYVDCGDNYTICLHIYTVVDSEDDFLGEDEVVDFIRQFEDFFTVTREGGIAVTEPEEVIDAEAEPAEAEAEPADTEAAEPVEAENAEAEAAPAE